MGGKIYGGKCKGQTFGLGKKYHFEGENPSQNPWQQACDLYIFVGSLNCVESAGCNGSKDRWSPLVVLGPPPSPPSPTTINFTLPQTFPGVPLVQIVNLLMFLLQN